MAVNLLTFIHKGECVFKINETEHELKAGSCVLVPKGTYYKPHTDTFCEYTFFQFDGELEEYEKNTVEKTLAQSDSAASFYGFSEEVAETSVLYLNTTMSTRERAQDIELLLNKCVNTRINHTSKRQVMLSLYFSEMLFHLSETVSESLSEEKNYPQSLNKILNFLKENYNSSIRLEDVCKHTSISKQYCMRLFKKYLNTTINDYVLELRMKHAVYLLRYTYMNVNQTADYLGFSSVSYFSRVFKKYYGVAPSEYFE